jgi:4a-hydroxytetrahydrobiopterin dehydratase
MTPKQPKISDAEIQQAVGSLPGWKLEGGMIVKTYELPTFPEAIVFVNAVAHLAELANHHPDVDIRYSKITLRLVTHDSGGITAKDAALAKEVEAARAKLARQP